MRASRVLVAVLLVWCPLALGQETEADRQKEILKELHALRESVDELSLRVQALEQKVGEGSTAASTSDDEAMPGVPGNWQEHGPDLQALAKIKLPQNPTKDQVRQYVAKIVAASRSQNTFSDSDPQVAMLQQVGPENLDVLLDAYGRRRMGSYHLQYAIVRLAGPEQKDLILKALPAIPDLAQVVMKYGWQEDAKDTLMNGLETMTDYLPADWMQATASLRSPEAVKALKMYLIRGQNREDAFQALRMMPDVGDLASTVASAWQAARFDDSWQTSQMAEIAVAYGHVDALGYLINQLNSSRNSYYDKGTLRSLVLRYSAARGSDQAMADWFSKNEANLVWDADAKQYKVKEPAKAGP